MNAQWMQMLMCLFWFLLFLFLSAQQIPDIDKCARHELTLTYKTSPLRLPSLFLFLPVYVLYQLNKYAGTDWELKGRLRSFQSQRGGVEGLNVIHSLGSVASARPEGRSEGLMKTNPSLCCLGNRAESWRATEVRKSFRVWRQREGWTGMKGSVCACMCVCVCGMLSKAELAEGGRLSQPVLTLLSVIRVLHKSTIWVEKKKTWPNRLCNSVQLS